MTDKTTIQVEKSTKKNLDKIGNKGQTYDDIINSLLKITDKGNLTTDEDDS